MLEWAEFPAAPLAAVAAAAIGGAATIAMAGGFGGNREAARAAVRRGMELFVENDVQGSVVEFDRALQLDPSQEPYLWQRGLSLYYLGRFQEAAEQFRKDVAVNPNDTEEILAAAAADFGRPSALFYANLYVGLFHESEGDQDQSRRYILEAAQSPYGLRSGDYMAALARVHCLQRGWL
ncbi:unnamed protein product [Closterium sp. Yama58-4]|nr:unnamed protein product [Closterium sp. Yama58-4]